MSEMATVAHEILKEINRRGIRYTDTAYFDLLREGRRNAVHG